MLLRANSCTSLTDLFEQAGSLASKAQETVRNFWESIGALKATVRINVKGGNGEELRTLLSFLEVQSSVPSLFFYKNDFVHRP